MTLKTTSLCLAAAVFCSFAQAATINFGDFEGETVTFEDVTDDNSAPTTLFANDDNLPTTAGDMLILTPEVFEAEAPSGGGTTQTDSTLTTLISSDTGFGIDEIVIDEIADYSLTGLANSDALASIGATVVWRVTEVDGEQVSLPAQMISLSFENDGTFTLADNPGLSQLVEGTGTIDVAGYLSGEGISGLATGVVIRLTDTLAAIATDTAISRIAKESVDINVTTTSVFIPEPTTAVLGIIGLAAVSVRRRNG